jgi:hypothetical protein
LSNQRRACKKQQARTTADLEIPPKNLCWNPGLRGSAGASQLTRFTFF